MTNIAGVSLTLALLVVAAASITGLILFVSQRAKKVAAEVVEQLGGDDVLLLDDRANCFGVESRGATQLRGNGCLALTADEIVFVMWVPRREVRMARHSITSIEAVKRWLGKTVGRPLLCIRYVGAEGPDAVAFLVRDLAAWQTSLDDHR